MDKIITLADLKREFAPIENPNEIHKRRLTGSDKIALFITRHVGTMTFFYFCLVLVTTPSFSPPPSRLFNTLLPATCSSSFYH